MTLIIEQLAEKIIARLKDITIANGFQQDVADVVRPKRLGGFTPKDCLIVMYQGDEYGAEDDGDASSDGNRQLREFWQPWELHLYRRPGDKSDLAVDTLINVFKADVEIALAGDEHWHDWDGLAVNSRLGTAKGFVTPNGDHEGVMLPLEIHYRYREGDPYTAA